MSRDEHGTIQGQLEHALGQELRKIGIEVSAYDVTLQPKDHSGYQWPARLAEPIWELSDELARDLLRLVYNGNFKPTMNESWSSNKGLPFDEVPIADFMQLRQDLSQELSEIGVKVSKYDVTLQPTDKHGYQWPKMLSNEPITYKAISWALRNGYFKPTKISPFSNMSSSPSSSQGEKLLTSSTFDNPGKLELSSSVIKDSPASNSTSTSNNTVKNQAAQNSSVDGSSMKPVTVFGGGDNPFRDTTSSSIKTHDGFIDSSPSPASVSAGTANTIRNQVPSAVENFGIQNTLKKNNIGPWPFSTPSILSSRWGPSSPPDINSNTVRNQVPSGMQAYFLSSSRSGSDGVVASKSPPLKSTTTNSRGTPKMSTEASDTLGKSISPPAGDIEDRKVHFDISTEGRRGDDIDSAIPAPLALHDTHIAHAGEQMDPYSKESILSPNSTLLTASMAPRAAYNVNKSTSLPIVTVTGPRATYDLEPMDIDYSAAALKEQVRVLDEECKGLRAQRTEQIGLRMDVEKRLKQDSQLIEDLKLKLKESIGVESQYATQNRKLHEILDQITTCVAQRPKHTLPANVL